EAAFFDETIYSPRGKEGENPQYNSAKLQKGVHSGLKRNKSFLISYRYIDQRNKEKVENKIVDFLVIEKYQTKDYSKRELAMFLANKDTKGKVIDAKIHTDILKYQLITVNDYPLSFVSSAELHNAKQFLPSSKTLEKLSVIYNEKDSNVDFLKETFADLSKDAINQYSNYLPESRLLAIEKYVEKVQDIASFYNGFNEIMKMASASAARSTIFGGRYERKLNPSEAKFIYQSITGLNYRRPKSFKNELWSK